MMMSDWCLMFRCLLLIINHFENNDKSKIFSPMTQF